MNNPQKKPRHHAEAEFNESLLQLRELLESPQDKASEATSQEDSPEDEVDLDRLFGEYNAPQPPF